MVRSLVVLLLLILAASAAPASNERADRAMAQRWREWQRRQYVSWLSQQPPSYRGTPPLPGEGRGFRPSPLIQQNAAWFRDQVYRMYHPPSVTPPSWSPPALWWHAR